MSPKNLTLAILFADISGSTQLFEKIGDSDARIIISKAIGILTDVTKKHKGKVVKTIGDEVMCIFRVAEESALAACDMQESMQSMTSERQIKIRIGMHFGPVLMEGDDVFGDAVNIAARMAAQAKGDQIITTISTVKLLPKSIGNNTRFVDRAHIKGKKEEIDIYEIIWHEEDATRVASPIKAQTVPKDKLVLKVSYGNKNIEVNQEKSSLSMGRSQACDLPINEKLASRQHVSIELRRDKFFIIDKSTNGTHVSLENEGDSFLRREEMRIYGNGKISLGKPFEEVPTEVVYFKQD